MKACPFACVGSALSLFKGLALGLSSFNGAQFDRELADGSTVLTVDPELAEWVEGSNGPQPPHRGRE